MVVNPDKFQVITFDKRKSAQTNECIATDNQHSCKLKLKRLGLQLDNKLNFNLHISKICINLQLNVTGFR